MKHFFTLTLLFIGQVFFAQTFENLNAFLPDLFNSVTAFGDVDGDGDLDLYLSGVQTNNELVGGLYLYDSGSYTYAALAGLPPVSLGSARWGDIDNDSDLDILIMGYDDPNGTGFTDIFLNDGTGNFTPIGSGIPPAYMGESVFADINNDGYLDVALTAMETVGWTFVTKFYKNNGDTTFTELSEVSLPGMNFGNIAFADYNNDTYLDFVLNGLNDTTYEYYTRIFTNNGDETFTDSGIEIREGWLGDMEWGDYNADGNIDLVTSGTGGDSGMERMTLIYKNNGDGTFTDINANLMGVSHSALEWGDFDGDSDLDILVIGTFTTPGEGNYTYSIYNNNGDDTFTVSSTAVLVGSYYGDVDSGDIDGDGRIDLVISGYDEFDSPATAVFMNTTTLGLDEFVTKAFSIYPNPNADRLLNLDFNASIANSSEVSIVTFEGVCVYKDSLQNSTTIDLTNLSSGTYIIKVVSNNQVGARKLVIE